MKGPKNRYDEEESVNSSPAMRFGHLQDVLSSKNNSFKDNSGSSFYHSKIVSQEPTPKKLPIDLKINLTKSGKKDFGGLDHLFKKRQRRGTKQSVGFREPLDNDEIDQSDASFINNEYIQSSHQRSKKKENAAMSSEKPPKKIVEILKMEDIMKENGN